MKTWHTSGGEKAEWGAGPWVTEPDKAQWVDGATGLDCLVVRGPSGALCGYVGVPPEHPFYGREYDKVPDMDVHGGLSFAARCDEEAEEGRGICHVPDPGRPDDVWWFGFDCAHAFDLCPGREARYRALVSSPFFEMRSLPSGVPPEAYRALPYVRSEVERLAEQLAGAGT